MATKVVGFKIELQGDEQLSKDLVTLTAQLNKLTEEKKALDKELKDDSVDKSAEDLAKLNAKIAETAVNLKATRSELGKQQKDFIKNRNAINATTGSYNDLVKRNQALRAELKALPNAFDKTNVKANQLKKEISGVTTELKQFDKELGDSFRDVGNYGSALEGLAGKLQGLNLSQTGANVSLSGSGGIIQSIIPQIAKVGGVYGIAAAAVVGGTVAITDALLDLTKEINKANSEVTKLFGTTGEELQKLTSGIQATADTFGKDFNEVLVVTNTLAKEFGLSGEEALAKINQGFLAGADINNEFLDTLREYPTQFRESGFSADEFISIITAQTKEGIFSDKGIDAVKEFGLAIREQTEPAKKALEDAFGKTFTDKLLKGVRDGSISTAQALKQVTTGLQDSGIQADRVGAVLADLFKGAGEDAGLRFIQSLSDINTNIGDLVDETDKYTQSQLKLLDANQRIELAQQQIVAAFDLTGDELSGLTDQFTAFALETLVKVIDVGVDIINFFIELNNQSAAARGVFEFFGASVATVIDAVVFNFSLLFDSIKLTGQALKAVFTLDFGAIKSIFAKGFTDISKTVIDFGKDTASNFTSAFQNTIKQEKPIEKISKETLFKPAEKIGAEAGKVAGDSFVKGIQTTTSDSKKAEETAKKANEANKKAFKKFFTPLDDLDFKIDPEQVFQFVDTEGEQNAFQKLFGLTPEEQAGFIEEAKDLAAALADGVNEVIFAGKQKRLDEETNAELSELEKRKAQELDNANLTDAEKLAIEEKFAVERGKIELEAAKKTRALETKQAVISAFLAGIRALAAPPGPPFTIPAAASATAFGLVQAGKIAATPLALGGDFVTSGPQLLLVGDNPGGQERVQVTPMSSPNVNGPQVNQNFVNNNQGGMSVDEVARVVIQSIESIPVIVREGDISTAQGRTAIIEGQSGF